MARGRYNNQLVRSEHHDAIMAKYHERLAAAGKVHLKDFHREIIQPLLPGYGYNNFVIYINNLKADAAAGVALAPAVAQSPAVQEAFKTLMKADEATRRGIELALNIGASALEEIAKDPSKLSVKDRALLLNAAMRAQDSRINAMARVRQDKREQLAFEHVFGDAAYAEENE